MRPITFAHRGGRAGGPENTVVAFQRALELGASGLESDARLAGDGQVVLAHGAQVRVGLRRVRIDALDAPGLADLGVARLADLYAELGSDYELSLDLKEPAAAEPILRLARIHGDVSRLWLCSGDLDVLRAVRRAEPDVKLVHSLGRRRDGDTLERHAHNLVQSSVAALNLRDAEWSAGLVALAHRFDLLAFAWDVQETRRLRALLQMGVDAVYSDHVDRMVATVGEWSPDS